MSDTDAVRLAVCGTLNRDVDVKVARQGAERWAISFQVNGRRAPDIIVGRMEMAAMRQVPLVPAHLRGHFLRNYMALQE